MKQDHLSSYASAKWIVMWNIVQKLLNLGLTQTLLRIASPEVYGKAAIQLELFLSMILFLSREGIRLALLREKIDQSISRQQFINFSWIPAVVLLILSGCMMICSLEPDIYAMYCSGAALEAMGEPWINMSMAQSDLRPKLTAETSAIIGKSIVLIISLGYFHMGVQAFGIGQIAYGLIYLISLTITTRSVGLLLPTFSADCLVKVDALKLAISLTIPLILKNAMTESDKIALTIAASNYDKGIYALASNYGSLAARIIFLPLEDTSRIAFSKLSSTIKQADEHQATTVREMRDLIVKLIQLVLFIGSIFIIFGIPYAEIFVSYILSSKWRSNDMIVTLQCYCLYLLFLGINGITEAYVHSVSASDDLYRAYRGLVLSSIIFMLVVYLLYPYLGTPAVVIANCCAMAIRSLGSISFIDYYLSKHSSQSFSLWKELYPSTSSIMMVTIFALLTFGSKIVYENSVRSAINALLYVAIGGVFGISYLGSSLMIYVRSASTDDIEYLSRMLPSKLWKKVVSSLKTNNSKTKEA
jgi:oligosaccharide translocation protein RFT1